MAKFSLGLGEGLLSDVSKKVAEASEDPVRISIDLIDENELNEGMSMDEIEELAASIKDVGLQQNLVVIRKADGRYRLAAGHRRYRAIMHGREQGWDNLDFMRPFCLVKDPQKIDLPLSEEGKEKYLVSTTNVEMRKNTPSDLIKMYKMMSEVYDELRANGYSQIGKRREYIAERLGVSPSTVKNAKYIDEHLTDEYRDALEKDNLSLTVALEVAHLNPEDQQALHAETADVSTLSVADVQEFKASSVSDTPKKAKKKPGPRPNEPVSTDKLCSFDSRIEHIQQLLRTTETVPYKIFTRLESARDAIDKQLKAIETLLQKANMVTVPVLLSPSVLDALSTTNRSINDLVNEAVTAYLNDEHPLHEDLDARKRYSPSEVKGKRKNILLPADTNVALESYATKHDLSKNAVITCALIDYLGINLDAQVEFTTNQ